MLLEIGEYIRDFSSKNPTLIGGFDAKRRCWCIIRVCECEQVEIDFDLSACSRHGIVKAAAPRQTGALKTIATVDHKCRLEDIGG